MRRTSHPWMPNALLVLLMALYIGYFGVYSITLHDAQRTHARDLGNMDQPIWNTLQGRILEETRADGRQATRLTDHVEPFFILVAFSFLLWDDVRMLLLVQTILIALGALPVYWLARDQFMSPDDPNAGEWMGVLFAAVYLLFPALEAANLTEFHAAPLAVPFLLGAYYFGRRGSALGFWAAALLALSTKEEISLLLFLLGLYLAVFGKRRMMGIALAIVSAVWFVLATFVIIPHFASEYYAGLDQSIYFFRYSTFGSSPKEIFLNLLRRPGEAVRILLEPARLRYLAGLLASAAWLPLLDPLTTLIALPLYLANALSDYPLMYSGELHYSAPLVPFFVAGAVGGAGRLFSLLHKRLRLGRRIALAIIVAWVLSWSLGYHIFRGYTPLGMRFHWPQVTAHHRLLERFAAQIPPDAGLSTTPALFPHFSHRQRIFEFPVFTGDTDYVLLDVAGTTDMHPRDFYRSYWDLFGFDFSILDAADGYILLRQEADHQRMELPAEFYSFVRVTDERPAYPYDIEFGGVLRFLGYTIVDDPWWKMSRLRTYWEVLSEAPPAFRPYPFVMDSQGNMVDNTDERPMPALIWYPPQRWQKGEILAFETLPWTWGEECTIGVGVINGANWYDIGSRVPAHITPTGAPAFPMEGGTWVRLGTFIRRPAWQGGRLQPISIGEDAAAWRFQPAAFTFTSAGDTIELKGFRLEPSRPAAGGSLTLTLLWQAAQPIQRDYTVFVHLVSEDGATVAQVDSFPNWRGPLPTSAWPAGQLIPDTHSLNLPVELAPGPYRLRIGLYYWQDLAHLEVHDAAGTPLGTELILAEVQVRAP